MRKAIGEFKNQQKEETNEGQKLMNEVMDKVSNVFNNKADTERVTTLETTKANKSDMEQGLKWIDLLHKVLKQFTHLYST